MRTDDVDEISPKAWWSDERIIEWARAHRLDCYPVAKVPLLTTQTHDADTARIDFQSRTVERYSILSPTPPSPQ